ncbi:MAG: hypothetical protein ACM32I_06435 [Nitrospirota bacterium]
MQLFQQFASYVKIGTLAVLCLLGAIHPAHAESDPVPHPFAAGTARISLALGGATAFNRDYSVFGIGVGYFVADGIEAGLDVERWFGNSPRIEQASPQLRMGFNIEGKIKPFVGAYYRLTHIENYRDLDTVGGRAGLYVLAGRNAYLGVGIAQDFHLNCDRTVYASCSETFPELLVAVMF